MGFSEEFVNNAAAVVDSHSLQSDFNFIKRNLQQAIVNVAHVAPYFNPNDVSIYLQGSYACKTNTRFQAKMEIIVEINKTREFDYDKMSRADMRLRDNFFVDFEHYFTVKHFKDVLAEEISKILNVKVTKKATTILIPAFGKLEHSIDLFPCFKYKYFRPEGGSIRGKLVYDQRLNEHFLMFTNLHTVNGNLKDNITHGNFKRIVRLMKNLVAISAREDLGIHYVRGYYIECLLYNVPNEMYFANDGKLSSVFLKVINWLNFANLDDFVCQNRTWTLWGNADGFWDQNSARQFINDIIEFYEAFPEKRTEIIKEDE